MSSDVAGAKPSDYFVIKYMANIPIIMPIIFINFIFSAKIKIPAKRASIIEINHTGVIW